jgi:hypothetical protein
MSAARGRSSSSLSFLQQLVSGKVPEIDQGSSLLLPLVAGGVLAVLGLLFGRDT